MKANQLEQLPDGVAEAAELIEGLDQCLLVGFARLGDQHRQSIDETVATLAGSPLEEVVADGAAGLGRSEYLPQHFLAIASARAALQGAQHDALLQQALDALQLEPVVIEDPATVSAGAHATLLGSTQQWLVELALAGFKHLAEEAVAPFMATLERIQAQHSLTHLAALLTGFVNELLAYMPTERQPNLPVYRWADFWTAAMVRTQGGVGTWTYREVEGIFYPLGVDLQTHENFAVAMVHGVFETADDTLSVRAAFQSYKVDVIGGAEIWELFGEVADPVLKALESRKSLSVKGAELWSTGDLMLKSKPRLSKAYDPFLVAERITALPAPQSRFRHPIHIAQPVLITVPSDIEIDLQRLPLDSDLADVQLDQVELLVGLLRFDGGAWKIQPLAVRGKKGDVLAGQSAFQRKTKLKAKTLPVLRERAGKLLRE